MGNQASTSNPPSSSRYQSSTLPDSFFTSNSLTTTENPPPYARHSSALYADTVDTTKIVFRSSDGDYFSLDRKDCEAHTGALIPATRSPRSMVDLNETSTILRTLFEFVGPRKHPKLLNEKFDFLAEVARAAEKYKIFSAMNICAERMRSFGDRYPKLVLLYAAHHDYPHIFDECAPRVITSENLEYLTPLLPDNLHLPWLRYQARWSKALSEIISYSSIPASAWSSNNCWRFCGQQIYHALGTGVHSLNDHSRVFSENVKSHTDSCSKCSLLCAGWKAHADKSIDDIGVFSEKCMDETPLVKVE